MKVPFDSKGAKDCICGQCPVQVRSACSKEKDKVSRSLPSPKPKDVSRLYCSSGKAACKDLELKQMCICGACPVWRRNKLSEAKPTLHFCRDGRAS